MSEKSETKTGSGVRVWRGKLRLRGERNKEGAEVDARIIVTGAAVVFEVRVQTGERETTPPQPIFEWRAADPNEIHAASWLRALGMTGAEVA